MSSKKDKANNMSFARLGGSMMFLDFGFGDSNEKQSKEKLQKRFDAVLERPDHKVCCDCSAEIAGSSGWVCMLENPVDQKDFRLGLLCCPDCATSFHELGSDVCRLKIANDEMEEEEVKALENTGNEVVNSIYEAKLSPEEQENERKKKGFIRHKYQTLKFFSKKVYEEHHTAILEKEARAEEEHEERKKERKKADKAEKQKLKEEEKQRKKAKEAEKKKKKEESKNKEKGDPKLDGSINLDDLHGSFNLEDDETERQGNNSERLANSCSNLLSYKVKNLEDGEVGGDPLQTNDRSPAGRPKVRRRRSGRGSQQLGMGDPLSAQSDHVPMMRRGRNRGGNTEKREKKERGESPARKPRASHSPVPGRVSRPNARNKEKDMLGSQSDHVSTSRRKARERRLKDIHWDPSDLPAETLNASRKITPSLIAKAQSDMASSFDGLGFDDIDYESFQNRVAPGQYCPVQTSSHHQEMQQDEQSDEDPDVINPDESASDFAHDGDDLDDTSGFAAEEPVEEEPVKQRRSGKGSSRPKQRRDISPKPQRSSDDVEDQEEDYEVKRREGTGDQHRERKKRSERHGKGDGHGNKDRPKRRSDGRRKRLPESGDSRGDETIDDQEGGTGEGPRRRKPPSRTHSGRNERPPPVARTLSGGSNDGRERRPVTRTTSAGKDKPRRGDRRVSTANMGRRAKLNASSQAINFDYLAPTDEEDDSDDEEQEAEEENQLQSTDGMEDEEEEKSKKKKGSLAKLKNKTAGLVKGTVKGTMSTISTIDPRKKKSNDGANDGPVSDEDNEDAESINLMACAG